MKSPTRQRLIALSTQMCERAIDKKLALILDAGERLVLDPDDSAVIELREHCQGESVRPPRAPGQAKRA